MSRIPSHINPIEWNQAIGLSRQTCSRVFRDGGTPSDAVAAFGLCASPDDLTWEKAVDHIASEICAHPVARAA